MQRASRALADRAVKKALEELAKSQGVGHLLPALNDKEENVRVNVLSVFNALALYDSEEAFHGLMSALDDGTLFVRIRAAKALEGMKDARAEVGLRRYRQQVLSEIAKSYVSLINASEDGTQVGLIDALDVYGSKTMAEDFLNCGGEELKSAAIDWAARHRLIVTRGGASGSSPRWHPH